MVVKDILIAILAVPFVLAAAIGIMMISYMLVPVMIVGFISAIVYIVRAGNKPDNSG